MEARPKYPSLWNDCSPGAVCALICSLKYIADQAKECGYLRIF